MLARKCPVLVDTPEGRIRRTGLSASPEAHPVEVSLALREKGLRAYRVEFDFEADAWIVRVIDWDLAA